MHKVYLSLGSNIGDSEANIEQAIELINGHDAIEVKIISCFYKTKPYGPVEQDDFVNIAAEIETTLEPMALLDHCQWVEQELKRVREVHWGPRTIDVDILTYDEAYIDEERLKIPHVELFKRAFVLIPLQEICNDGMIYGVDLNEQLKSIETDGVRKI